MEASMGGGSGQHMVELVKVTQEEIDTELSKEKHELLLHL